jgi:hypothetical protein
MVKSILAVLVYTHYTFIHVFRFPTDFVPHNIVPLLKTIQPSSRRLKLIIPERFGYCESFTLDHWTGYVNVFLSCIREPLPHYLIAGYL